MSRPTRYSPPFRARAVAQVAQVRSRHRSEWSAIESVADALGISREALRGWIRQAEAEPEVERRRPSTSDRQQAEIRRLTADNARLRTVLRVLRASNGDARATEPGQGPVDDGADGRQAGAGPPEREVVDPHALSAPRPTPTTAGSAPNNAPATPAAASPSWASASTTPTSAASSPPAPTPAASTSTENHPGGKRGAGYAEDGKA
ncbi:transposase [Frankia sp. CH37]|nr:transposase [Parafrankia sp. CH37]